jgi:hypothetical protein
MSYYHSKWMLVLGLSVGIATTALTTQAAQPKNKTDLAAEAKAAAEEDAREAAEGESGKQQRTFSGVFAPAAEGESSPNPAVVGSFVTDSSDVRPNRTYLAKLETGSKGVIEALRRNAGKKVRVTGKLRNIGEDGEAKYLIVTAVLEASPTPHATERRKRGGV